MKKQHVQKIVVFGSRSICDVNQIARAIINSGYKQIPVLITGCAIGVDQTAEYLLEDHVDQIVKCPANWKRFGKRAGMLRNELMAELADVGIAVWDGKSRGTKHMIDELRERNKPVFVELIR